MSGWDDTTGSYRQGSISEQGRVLLRDLAAPRVQQTATGLTTPELQKRNEQTNNDRSGDRTTEQWLCEPLRYYRVTRWPPGVQPGATESHPPTDDVHLRSLYAEPIRPCIHTLKQTNMNK